MADLDKTREIVYEGFRVVVRPANYRIGLTRTLLMDQARRETPGEPDVSDAEALALAFGRVMLWPALVAPVVEHDGFDHWPPTADELLDMPEPFVSVWEQAVYALNPHWRAVVPEEADAEKKAGNG